MKSRSVLLLALTAFAAGATPAALFTGVRCGIIEYSDKAIAKYVNSVLSRLVADGIVHVEPNTPDGGVRVVFEDQEVKIPKGSRVYSSSMDADVFKKLSQDTQWCDPIDTMKRKGTKHARDEACASDGSSETEAGASPKRICA